MKVGGVDIVSEFLECIRFRAASGRGDRDVPSARGRAILTSCLMGRLGDVNMDSTCHSGCNCICKRVPTAGKFRGLPGVKLVSRVSASPSIDKGSIGTGVVGFSNAGTPVVSTGCSNRSVVIASQAALLNTSSGTNITRVVRTYHRVYSSTRLYRNGVSVYFAPSRRVNENTSGFSFRAFSTSFTCAISNKRLNKVRCRGFGTTNTGVAFGKIGARPNSTGGGVGGTILCLTRFVGVLPTTRTPTRARGHRKFCRISSIGNGRDGTALRVVVESRGGRDFTGHGRFVAMLIRFFGHGCKRGAISTRVGSDCCGVLSIVGRRVSVMRQTGGTVHGTNIRPRVAPVHNKASNTELSFRNLPYPGLSANKVGFRDVCRTVPMGTVLGVIRIVGGLMDRWLGGRGIP